MSKESDLKILKLANVAFSESSENLNRAKVQMTVHCPHQVGDNAVVTEYAHHGKVMRVKNLKVEESFGKWYYRVSGYVLKKDGTPGKQKAESVYPVEV